MATIGSIQAKDFRFLRQQVAGNPQSLGHSAVQALNTELAALEAGRRREFSSELKAVLAQSLESAPLDVKTRLLAASLAGNLVKAGDKPFGMIALLDGSRVPFNPEAPQFKEILENGITRQDHSNT